MFFILQRLLNLLTSFRKAMLKVGAYAKFTPYFAAILKVIILICKQKFETL